MSARPKVAVVGAGVAGATAAYGLEEAGYLPVVFEAADEVGGRTQSVHKGGFIFDTGAVGLLGSYHQTRDVASEIGMSDQILTVKPIGSVPRDGELKRLNMARPLRSFLKTDLLSTRSKFTLLKAAVDVLKLRKSLGYDLVDELVPHDTESVSEYSLRELNGELYEYLTGTLIRGAWLANPEQASIAQFFWTAKNFTPHMYSILGGMQALPTRLLRDLDVRLSTEVLNVDERRDKVTVAYRDTDGQHFEDFDACVIATPPARALAVFPQMGSAQKTFYENAEYSRSVNVHLGLSAKTDHPDLWVMVPERECADITTIFLDHHKAPDRAPEGKGIISVFLRSEWCAANYETDPATVLDEVVGKLRPWFGDLSSRLEETVVHRWQNCAVKVRPGLFTLMSNANKAIDPGARVQLAGDAAPFSSVNTALVSGQAAAWRVAGKLGPVHVAV
jgi:protoporphyrinogen/coproporphyrinogen III oxidase